jgi:hypothetical protein
MYKIGYDTTWLKSFRFCIIALCFACSGFAQDGATDSVTVTDSGPQIETSPIQTQAENNFDTISGGAAYVQLRKIPDSSVDRIRKDEDYWYANLAPVKKEEQKVEKKQSQDSSERKNIFETGWFNALFWIIIVGSFVAVLVWYLASSDIRLFRKPSAVVADAGDETIEDIFELNYDKEITAAIDAQNFRLATRLMYLQTLKELSDRELIQYKNERTNSDYLFQLTGTKYYKDFFRLTRDFEYTWYGDFPLSPDAFAIVQKDFSSFKQQLS